VELLFGLIWFGFWIWVLRGAYRWVTRGLGRAFVGTWDAMFDAVGAAAPITRDYERREVVNPSTSPNAASPADHVASDLERTLRQEEASAAHLAQAIGANRRSMAPAPKRAPERRPPAQAAGPPRPDDLARDALAQAQACDEAVGQAEEVIAELQPILDSYEAEIDALRRQLDDGLRRKLIAEARMERARAGQRAARWLSPEAQASMTEVMNAEERRADLAEGEWEAAKLGRPASPGAFGRKGAATAALPAPPAAATLTPIAPAPISAETERRWDAAIERQLAELKTRSGSHAA